jgi:hypothetical protein
MQKKEDPLFDEKVNVVYIVLKVMRHRVDRKYLDSK